MADPWDNVPVVRSRQQGTRYETISSSYTNETPEQLRAQGYEQDETGTWFRVVGTRQEPAVEVAPWDDVPVATESQLRAEEIAARRAQTDANSGPGSALYQGLLLGFSDELAGGIAGLGQMASNAIRTATGRPIEVESADLRDALTRQIRQEQDRFAMERPVSNAALQFAGGALTGGGAVGSGIRGAAATGTLYGAGYGAGTGEGGFAERLPGAATGAVVGGALGGAVQGGMTLAAPYAQRLAGIAGSINPGAQARAATRRVGPEAGAATRLSQYATPEAFAERQRLQNLGLEPSVLDVIGGTGERAIRAAAGPAGPGAEAAVNNLVTRQAALKPEITEVTRGLTPETRTVDQLREGITDLRSNLASEQYAPAYEARVSVTPELRSALGDAPGRAALDRALRAAVARRDEVQADEIQALMNGATDEVSAGTLDRIRIALSGRAEDLMRRPGSRDIASGIAGRAADVDMALEAVPELAPARATYRELSGALEQLDNGAEVFNTNPQDFASQVATLTPTQREALVVSVRDRITNMLGGQRETGMGSLQTIAEAPYSRQNLATLLGEDEAARYLGSIQERVRQVQRAARVSPNTNSQTYGRAVDDATFNTADALGAVVDAGQSLTGNGFAIARTIDRLRTKATLSPEERASIVELGLGSADELERIVRIADEARAANRPPPRAVRQFVDRTRNALGSQNPVAVQIQTLLLPSRVAAEEEQQ